MFRKDIAIFALSYCSLLTALSSSTATSTATTTAATTTATTTTAATTTTTTPAASISSTTTEKTILMPKAAAKPGEEPPEKGLWGIRQNNNEPVDDASTDWGIAPVPQANNSASKEPDCSVVNGGCQHICTVTSRGPVCSCWPGYLPGSDARNCYDMITSRQGAAYCINARQKISELPRDTQYFAWLYKDTNIRRGCNLRGVLRIAMPPWATQLVFNFVIKDPRGYTFHVADSAENVANRKKRGSDIYDAEIFGKKEHVIINKNSLGTRRRQGLLTRQKNLLLDSQALQVTVWTRRVTLNNYSNLHKTFVGQLFRMDSSLRDDYIYLGLNRIVHQADGRPTKRRTGRGLCHVCMYFI